MKWPAWMLAKKTELEVDEVSWWVHWLIVFGGSGLVSWPLGQAGGLGAAILFLAYFGFREGGNLEMHRRDDAHGMKRWTKDGILDFAGPFINTAIWFVGVVVHG